MKTIAIIVFALAIQVIKGDTSSVDYSSDSNDDIRSSYIREIIEMIDEIIIAEHRAHSLRAPAQNGRVPGTLIPSNIPASGNGAVAAKTTTATAGKVESAQKNATTGVAEVPTAQKKSTAAAAGNAQVKPATPANVAPLKATPKGADAKTPTNDADSKKPAAAEKSPKAAQPKGNSSKPKEAPANGKGK